MASFASPEAEVGRRRKTGILRRADGTVICERCFVADTMFTRMKGLLGRSKLEADEGILIRPCGSIHTFFMRFPIDAIFVDREGVVLKIASHLGPWRTSRARRARSVVELAAGEAERRALAPGDRIQIQTRGS